MDLTDSRGCTYVSAQLLGRIYSSWPWQNDAMVVHDYAILMMMMMMTMDKYSLGEESENVIVRVSASGSMLTSNFTATELTYYCRRY